jgi:hypothetical protein
MAKILVWFACLIATSLHFLCNSTRIYRIWNSLPVAVRRILCSDNNNNAEAPPRSGKRCVMCIFYMQRVEKCNNVAVCVLRVSCSEIAFYDEILAHEKDVFSGFPFSGDNVESRMCLDKRTSCHVENSHAWKMYDFVTTLNSKIWLESIKLEVVFWFFRLIILKQKMRKCCFAPIWTIFDCAVHCSSNKIFTTIA